jgi:hypothetical protein
MEIVSREATAFPGKCKVILSHVREESLVKFSLLSLFSVQKSLKRRWSWRRGM